MRKSFWDRKIPTLIGLLIIIIGTIVTTFLVRGGSLLQIKAGPGQDPKNVQITNVSDTSFTVSYTTDDQVIGTINYGSDASVLDNVVLDDRDQLSQSVNKYKIHSITVKNLNPDTSYYFSITSGDKKYLNNDAPYSSKTAKTINKDPSSQIPLSGKVVLPDGSSPPEGLAYVNIDGAEKLSTYLKNDGTYTLPLNNLRNMSLDDYFSIEANTIIGIEVYAQNLFSSVSVSPGEISPVPLITLSNTYDFSNSPESTESGTKSNEEGNFPTFGTISKNDEPKIVTPTSGEKFTDPQPTFEGKAVPSERVDITIHSDENITTQVTADARGNWSYTPTKNLSPGDHSITITAKNTNGVLKTITQKFTVFAAGSEISPTPTTSLTPSPSPTPTPSAVPTPTSEITPVPTLPPTGNSSVIIATVVVIAAAFAGIILFFLTRGQSSL